MEGGTILSVALKEDYDWLGEYRGKKPSSPDVRVCSHCGREEHTVFVYNDGQAYYCSQECLLEHFTAEEWNEYVDRAESPDALEPGLAYVADYTGRLY